ncbi:unnamed protein product, partial [marine sediment metagenome]
GDTETCPWNQAVVASTCAHITGLATQAAAADAKRQICQLASRELGAKPEDIDIKNGIVFVKGQPQKSIPFANITAKTDGIGIWPTIVGSAAKNVPLTPLARMYMAHFVKVE